MNKIKSILPVILALVFVTLIVVIAFKARHNQVLSQQVVSGRELRGALNHLMVDLSQGRQAAFQHMPVDGLWHKKVAVIQVQHHSFEYFLLLRRQLAAPGILEVRVEDPRSMAMIYNFKVRVHL